ncbi:MAG: VanZ family protein [Elusimicrobiota bacterium]
MRTAARARAWAPVLIWCAVIFALSSTHGGHDPFKPYTPQYFLYVLTRKFCHVFEYFVLYGLVHSALRRERGRDDRWTTLIALTLTVAYAASDELHQSFVPGRSGNRVDVLIDFLGAAAARARLTGPGRVVAAVGAQRPAGPG